MIVENKICDRNFTYLEPWFYNNNLAMRCELGIGDTDEEYMQNAEQRAIEIFDILFANGIDAKAKEIQVVYDAIKKADPNEKLVQLKSLEALQEVAKGEANKIFIPFEATKALSTLGTMAKVGKSDKKN